MSLSLLLEESCSANSVQRMNYFTNVLRECMHPFNVTSLEPHCVIKYLEAASRQLAMICAPNGFKGVFFNCVKREILQFVHHRNMSYYLTEGFEDTLRYCEEMTTNCGALQSATITTSFSGNAPYYAVAAFTGIAVIAVTAFILGKISQTNPPQVTVQPRITVAPAQVNPPPARVYFLRQRNHAAH